MESVLTRRKVCVTKVWQRTTLNVSHATDCQQTSFPLPHATACRCVVLAILLGASYSGCVRSCSCCCCCCFLSRLRVAKEKKKRKQTCGDLSSSSRDVFFGCFGLLLSVIVFFLLRVWFVWLFVCFPLVLFLLRFAWCLLKLDRSFFFFF